MKNVVVIFFLLLLCAAPAVAAEKWAGIDEAVVEKFAEQRGAEAAEPLIPVEGDLLLFLFALAGAIGGFVMGYYWHKVFVVGKEAQRKE